MSRVVVASILGVQPEQINEELMQWAWEQRCGGVGPKLVFVLLCVFANSERLVRVDEPELALLASMTRKRVRAAINELARIGLIQKAGADVYEIGTEGSPLKPGERLRLYVTPEQRAEVLARDQFACVVCSSKDALQIDHITPRSRGGCNVLENLQTLCGACNQSKADNNFEEWLQARGRVQ